MDVDEAPATTAGLTAPEAAERRRRGEANTAGSGSGRSYAAILRTNVFSFFNVVLFVIGIALLALGRYSDAFTSVGLGLVNAVISAAQEIRAKRKLDRLQLLDTAPVLVLRDGAEVELGPADVVRGDVLRVRPGDQIVVDGPLLDGRVEADESLLTGESDPVAKEPGDGLRSGSLCVSGGGHQQAAAVGARSYAGRLTAEARRTSTDKTPLQRRIEFVVRLVIALTVLMSGAILAQAALEGFTLLRTVQITAVLSGLVPVIIAVTMLGLGFPYSPTQVGLTLLTVGVPTLFLTFWARPVRPDQQLLANLARFVIPAAVITAGFGTAVYAYLYENVSSFLTDGRTPTEIIADFEAYTGVSNAAGSDFTEAVATIAAQTGLQTFVC